MKNIIFLVFMIFVVSLNANDIVIEDAEDGKTVGWSIYDNNPSGATISNVIDSKQGRVIALNGAGLKNGYMLGHWGFNGFNLINKKLSWKMKYDEMFSVYIIVKTEDGNRYLWYTAEDTDRGVVLGGRYIHHGLGADAIDGTWHTFTRDLEADLQDYASSLHVLKVNAFLVRGSGYIDDIVSLDNFEKPLVVDAGNDETIVLPTPNAEYAYSGTTAIGYDLMLESVTLDINRSIPLDDDIVSLKWGIVEENGEVSYIDNIYEQNGTLFLNDLLLDMLTEYTLHLTATDKNGNTATDTMKLNVIYDEHYYGDDCSDYYYYYLLSWCEDFNPGL